jgi:hypothetical protein
MKLVVGPEDLKEKYQGVVKPEEVTFSMFKEDVQEAITLVEQAEWPLPAQFATIKP